MTRHLATALIAGASCALLLAAQAQAQEQAQQGAAPVGTAPSTSMSQAPAVDAPPPGAEPASPVAAAAQTNAGTDELVVTGSRIPRAKVEGPAPITVLNSETIQANGFTSVPDVLRAITQNAGETQSQQSFSGASFTPGAQQVDLRGLGPNHTLVLVNGRRIADFPLPFQGRSNFTDISNIPLGLIDRVEILSGSASAVYGSDAISGVVNFVMKRDVDGTRVDYRYGTTQEGGGESHRLTITSGYSKDRFGVVAGIELLDQLPLWAYDRRIQDSTADDPTTPYPVARRDFLRLKASGSYIDPGEAVCDKLSDLNMGSEYYGSRPRKGQGPLDGHYCGSNLSIGYGTIESQRRGFNTYGALRYTLGDHAELFTDFLIGYSQVRLMPDVLDWQFQDANGSEDGYFYNLDSVKAKNDKVGRLDSWYREFTPEESGGLSADLLHNDQTTISVTPGIKGSLFGDWNYELSFNHSQYNSVVSWPEVIAAKANALFLGPQYGVVNGYPAFHAGADADRLYTPLTEAEYNSITSRTVYHPWSQTDNLSLTINKVDLFHLPAGPVGFAAVAEAGRQMYDLQPDPLALTNYYYGLRDSDGKGARNHAGVGYEFRVPILKILDLSTAGRYDEFAYADHNFGKFTYDGGIEFRPLKSLLLRAAFGTGFRAPDLHYVYSGQGNTHPGGTDYYLCRTEEPGTPIGDCDYADEGIVATRTGNPNLNPETSKSLNYGFVFSPGHNFDLSVDYFRVQLKNGVQDLDIDGLLRQEANCRIGETEAGTPVDINSPTCQDAIARVRRNPPGNPVMPNGLVGVFINPVNIATEKTDGIDFAAHLKIPTRFGQFGLSASYTWVHEHLIQQYPGDPIVNELAFDSDYDVPRSKGNASITWTSPDGKLVTTLLGERLDKLPNYDEDAYIPATYLFNASIQYDIRPNARISLTIDNLFGTDPYKDPTYASYPYYDISWFDGYGRSVFLQLTYKFGGRPL